MLEALPEPTPAPELLALAQRLQLRREALIQQARVAAQQGQSIEIFLQLTRLAEDFLAEVKSHYLRMPLADAELTLGTLRGCNQAYGREEIGGQRQAALAA